MAYSLSAPLPASAFISLGGYRAVRAADWRRYLRRGYRSTSFVNLLHLLIPTRQVDRWRDNDCVLQALRQYLFHAHGMLMPEDTLFTLFNTDGQGILPADLLGVIEALASPLGYGVERVFAPDDDLRACLSASLAIEQAGNADDLDGQPGISMINIREGYSHAFYWPAMQTWKFALPQFRLAVTLKALQPLESIERSPRAALADLVLETEAAVVRASKRDRVLRSDLTKLSALAALSDAEWLAQVASLLPALMNDAKRLDDRRLADCIEVMMSILHFDAAPRVIRVTEENPVSVPLA